MALLELERISAQYPGAASPVLANITLSLGPRQLLVALGPSGSGKTSLLNLVAGFVSPSAGRITLDGVPVQGPGAERGVVFQDDALLPWQNVLAWNWPVCHARHVKPRHARCLPWSTLRISPSGAYGSFQAAKSSAWAWPVHWQPTLAYC